MYVHVERLVAGRWVYVPAPATRQPHKDDRGNVCPLDWFHDQGRCCYDTMAVLANVRNYDGIPPCDKLRKLQVIPEDATVEVHQAYDWVCECLPAWLMLADIKGYDFERTVSKPARQFSPEELTQRGWSGNGDGTPYLDIQSRRWPAWESSGYQLTEIPIRQLVQHDLLDGLIPAVEAACQGANPEEIRLFVWFD